MISRKNREITRSVSLYAQHHSNDLRFRSGAMTGNSASYPEAVTIAGIVGHDTVIPTDANREPQGKPVGPYDVFIAGQALARGLILVTHNVGEFQRVTGLHVEDWEENN